MTDVKFPKVTVRLTGNDGNAFNVIGQVLAGLRNGGASRKQIAECRAEMMSGDYGHLLQTAMKWVNVK